MSDTPPEADGPEAPDGPVMADTLPWLRSEPPQGPGLRGFLRVMRRRRALVFGTVLVITAAAVGYVNVVTPLYRAETALVIEGDQGKAPPLAAAVGGGPQADLAGQTQAAVIGSWDLAAQVVDHLKLVESPLYNPALRKPGSGPLSELSEPIVRLLREADVLRWLSRLFGELEPPGGDKPDNALGPAGRARQLRETVTDRYLAGLTVVPDPRSRVVTVRYVSPDPRMAALAANTTAELYLRQRLAQQNGGGENAADWLNQRAKELGERMAAAERKLEAFQRRSAAVPVGSLDLYEQQLARLNDQLSQARVSLAETRTRYDQAQQALKAPSQGATEAAASDNPLVLALQQQETKLQQAVTELRTHYRDSHPKIVEALAELRDLRQKMRIELNRISQNFGNQLQIAQVRERKIAQEVDRLQAMIQEQREAAVTKATLESELASSRQQYETILARLKAAGGNGQKATAPDARIISQATVPDSPYYPRKDLMVSMAFVASLLLGLGFARIAEFLDRGFHTRSELEAATGLPVLGMVPFHAKSARRAEPPHRHALAEPNSAYGEAIRALRTGLLLARAERPRTILLTSAVPGEGKTSTVMALAGTAARAGRKTILVECDVLRPALHTAMDCPQSPGLGEFLTGRAGIEDVVRIDPVSGAHYITAGERVANASDLLGTERLRVLVAALRETYDLVVIDSPPVLAVSDPVVVQRLVDETVVLVRWEKTPREILFAALKQITEGGGLIAGLVLTQVDIRKHARYEYGRQNRHYYSAYRAYHSDAN
jgi:succinoglycan biosynthesis transport protein ExoP